MFAVIRTGGKQYKVAQNDVLTIEKVAGDVGSTLTIGEVLIEGLYAKLPFRKVARLNGVPEIPAMKIRIRSVDLDRLVPDDRLHAELWLPMKLDEGRVAVAIHEGPAQGLCLIDDLLAREELANYSLAHSARADLCRRLGRLPEARASYQKALALAPQEAERRFLSGRLEELK